MSFKMKNLILPLILILLLTFTLISNCAWLSGYDQRIKLTIDNTKIDVISQYPPAQSDTYVKSTTKFSASYWAYHATDPTKSLTGSWVVNSWLSASGSTTNQRFHIDLGSAKIVKKIYYENVHDSGTQTNAGVQNFTFWGSNTGAGTFDDLIYANNEGWTQLTISQSTFDEHIASDVADPKYITVTNTIAYRYYAFKFADNHGGGSYISVRRIELQIDLSNFPVTVFFTSTQGEEIFTEFDADSDYMKCAFTSSDGTTQLYAEKELFDDSEQKAIYHVKVTSVASGADTDIYYYYDNDHADNTTYIGAINTTAGGHVWDSDFKAVYHMVDATTSTVVDSTSNNSDGTKTGANEPIQATGKVWKGQHFDGSNDSLIATHSTPLNISSQITVEMLVNPDDTPEANAWERFARKGTTSWGFDYDGVYFRGYIYDSSSAYIADDNPHTITNDWQQIAFTYDGSDVRLYRNYTEVATVSHSGDIDTNASDLILGLQPGGGYAFDGIMDEVRISSTARNVSWLKATYNTLWDTLLTYGSEETEAADNAIFFGTNF